MYIDIHTHRQLESFGAWSGIRKSENIMPPLISGIFGFMLRLHNKTPTVYVSHLLANWKKVTFDDTQTQMVMFFLEKI